MEAIIHLLMTGIILGIFIVSMTHIKLSAEHRQEEIVRKFKDNMRNR